MALGSSNHHHNTITHENTLYQVVHEKKQDLKHLTAAKNHGRVGGDLGVKQMVTLSDGHVFEAPKPLGKYLQKLKRLQRKMSRTKAKGSNRAKLGMGIA